MGRYGRRGTCDCNKDNINHHSISAGLVWTWNISILSSYHEGDFLAGLRLPADHEDAAAEDEKGHGQQRQAPHLHAEDGVDVVGGDVADHTHDQHCGLIKNKQKTISSHIRACILEVWFEWPPYPAHR